MCNRELFRFRTVSAHGMVNAVSGSLFMIVYGKYVLLEIREIEVRSCAALGESQA